MLRSCGSTPEPLVDVTEGSSVEMEATRAHNCGERDSPRAEREEEEWIDTILVESRSIQAPG